MHLPTLVTTRGLCAACLVFSLLSSAANAAGLTLTAGMACDAPTCYWTENRCVGAGTPDPCARFTTQATCEAGGPSGADQEECRLTGPTCVGDLCI